MKKQYIIILNIMYLVHLMLQGTCTLRLPSGPRKHFIKQRPTLTGGPSFYWQKLKTNCTCTCNYYCYRDSAAKGRPFFFSHSWAVPFVLLLKWSKTCWEKDETVIINCICFAEQSAYYIFFCLMLRACCIWIYNILSQWCLSHNVLI